jgi:hypothetical protein
MMTKNDNIKNYNTKLIPSVKNVHRKMITLNNDKRKIKL